MSSEVLDAAKDSMGKAVGFFKDQVKGMRHGEIGTALIDTIRVDCYGQKTPIKQIAFTSMDGGRIMISAYDPSTVHAINKAVEADGFNSYVFSKTQVVVNLPVRSGEDKIKVASQINKLAEEARVSIRAIRKTARQKSEDDIDKPLQLLTDNSIKEINSIAKQKIDSL